MKQFSLARVVVSIIFVGLLATPAIMRWRSAARAATSQVTLAKQVALARHGFYLEEVSRAAGVDFILLQQARQTTCVDIVAHQPVCQ